MTVLDLTLALAGPFATFLLVSLGEDVSVSVLNRLHGKYGVTLRRELQRAHAARMNVAL